MSFCIVWHSDNVMMNRDLTPDEVESLLAATAGESSGVTKQSQLVVAFPAASSVEAGSQKQANQSAEPATVDGSPALDQETSQRIAAALTAVGDRWCQALAEPLRTKLVIGSPTARLVGHAEFTSQIESPACVEVIQAESLGGYVYLQVDRSLVFAMIDRLLGGGQHPSPVMRRPLTEIETSLFLRITEPWREELSRQLLRSRPTSLQSLRVESKAERLPSNTDGHVVIADLSLRVENQTGRCRIGLPRSAASALPSRQPDLTSLLENLPPSGIAVIAGNVRVRRDEAHSFSVGQTVFADNALPRVYVDRKLMYSGRLGTSGGKKAVQIEDVES